MKIKLHFTLSVRFSVFSSFPPSSPSFLLTLPPFHLPWFLLSPFVFPFPHLPVLFTFSLPLSSVLNLLIPSIIAAPSHLFQPKPAILIKNTTATTTFKDQYSLVHHFGGGAHDGQGPLVYVPSPLADAWHVQMTRCRCSPTHGYVLPGNDISVKSGREESDRVIREWGKGGKNCAICVSSVLCE